MKSKERSWKKKQKVVNTIILYMFYIMWEYIMSSEVNWVLQKYMYKP